ncbi:LOW QUALITY PROTEIN: C3 and PZP-like alpha-2-macroglobulin domain-containing protein 8 [Lucilia sericata]|uniref:LOW QUALITY PROTEIN: C3 and PZP-like alpha-2-macroglobulin domain-containing protein 8 n=1 Tax=Lucilia sericata TaxID=13632 RepID=UPI0018A830E4|nr:LOW QUALITY PROTEIN: C3 and PZP-like alpha-2-macroglobulin domain-containing protein 8 [Lucilia sericata]
MKLYTIHQYFILLQCMAFIVGENYYSIIAPGLMKSNRKYTIAVTLHDSTTPCTIRVSIMGRSYNATDNVLLQPFESKEIDFFPPKLENGNYALLAEGMGACGFRNQSVLLIDSSAGPKIYVQTDKSVYKPLDLVQFRVVILDEHTRPVYIREPIRIEIFDSDTNRVKQFKDITLTKGVFTGKFQLSQQPVMGDWEIRTTISGKYSYQKSKKIKIQQYTLPKFDIFVDTPENVIPLDPHVIAEIYGKYTFDRYVKGFLTVQLHVQGSNDLIEEKVLHIDGLVVVDFDLEHSNKLTGVNSVVLWAKLEEKHTGIWRTYTQTIAIRKESYKILIPDDEIEFRNNKPFRLRAYIEEWNGGPVWDQSTPVILQHGVKKYQTYLNDKGVAVFQFDQQPDASYTVKFKDSQQTLPNIFVADESISYNEKLIYCRLTLKERPVLGKPVKVEVRSSFTIPYFVYTIVGHGSIVQTGLIKLSPNRKTYTLMITPSIELVPKSFLYVHYIQNGNFRYEELVLNFPLELENQISITAPKQVKPGQEVTLNLKAQPKSYVSILAVDLSVYILDKKYDIYKTQILEDLKVDVSYIPNAYIVRPGIISGLITLTNAHYPVKTVYPNIVSSAGAGPLIFRTKFPETWIFENYIINNTDTQITLNIPETITTWRITAFSNNDMTGFGIVDGPTDITTFLPFFITLNLPYSVKREETVVIPVTIFNYHNQSLDTDVILYNNNMQFRFMEPLSKFSPRQQQLKTINIPSNGGTTVKFLIKPLEVGNIELRIAANNSLYNDGIVQKLKVLPEGITQYQNKAIYLSATTEMSSLTLDIPLDSVRDSEYITLSVGGDFIIPSLENLNELIKMPTGCGEQNMVNFAPNILILDYLKANGKYSKEKNLVSKAKNYIEIGYQQELSFRHKNGGYSVFGENSDKEASNWLTAYVVRFLIKASKYIAIESRIIDSGLEYLANQQWFDGKFPYTGYLFYKELQNTYSFTAFVLLTFMEDRRYSRKYQTVIRKGLDYVTSDLDDIYDIYALSIIGTALSKAKHPSSDKVIEKIQSMRKEDEKGLMWWTDNTNDVETTAYVLMTLLNAPGNHLPIVKWLIKQRNQQGGFKSTHDTVVGLEALVRFSQKFNNESNWDLKISYSAQDHEGNEKKINEFSVNPDNALVLQQHELPKSVRLVNFEIKGSGYSLVQLSSRYNIKNDVDIKYFIMNVNSSSYNDEEMDLHVCFTYQALEAVNNNTNMVIMEANLPSGFKTEAEFSRDLVENEFIQRIETKNDETVAILYFDKLSTGIRHCVTIETFRSNEIEDQKPAAIVMYDYYNTNRTNTMFYTI